MITTDCNLNCTHCFAKKNDESGRYGIETSSLELNEIYRSVDFAIEEFSNFIDLSVGKVCRFELFIIGGEPLLEIQKIKKGVAYLKSKLQDLESFTGADRVDLEIMMVTNGLLLDEDTCEFIVNNNISISVSVDAPKHIMKTDDEGCNFTPKAIEGIKKLIQLGSSRTSANIVIPSEDVSSVEDVFEYLNSEGVLSHLKTVQMSPKIPPYRQTEHCGCKPTEVVISDFGNDEQSCLEFSNRMIELSDKYNIDMKSYYEKMTHLISIGGLAYRCPGAQWRWSIVPGGKIFPCQQLVNIGSFYMGNIHDEFCQIRKDMKVPQKKFSDRTVFNVTPCKDCPLQTICIVFVDCPARCFLENGDMSSVPLHYCKIAKGYLMSILDKKISEMQDEYNER